MTSLVVQFIGSLIGRAKGVTADANLRRTLNGRTFNASFSSTGTGATLANKGTDQTRTLAGGANETLDLRSFTSVLNETAQSMTKVKLFYVEHADTSAASGITVGNSGASAFIPWGIFGATGAGPIPPGGGVVIIIPSSAGIAVAAGNKDWKVVNNDGVNIATYYVGWWGE